jgi:hypothetical protein
MSREAKERAEVLRRIVERPPTDEGEPDREAMTRRKVCPSPNFCSICKVVDQETVVLSIRKVITFILRVCEVVFFNSAYTKW